MLRILIADDHPIVRAGLKQIIMETTDMIVADEASDGQEALSKVSQNDYDVVLLDISMPGMHGIDALRELRSRKPQLPILILTMHPEEQYGVRVLKAGAAGYLKKESSPNELVSAIRRVSQGRKYISPSLAERLASYLETDANKPLHERLSDREYQVMRMIASGKTSSQIANELSLSNKTVSTYRRRLLEKTGMKTNAELTRYAIRNGLAD